MIAPLLISGYGLFFSLYFGIPIAILLLYCLTRFYVVENGTAMVVERWGRFHRCCYGGWYFLMPFADKPRIITWRYTQLRGVRSIVHQTRIYRIDLRENVLDFPSQKIITRDNVEISVHPMLMYRLVDPRRVCYETYDLAHAMEKLVQTTLRSIIGDMGLDDTLASREEIERGLEIRIKNVANNWGLEIKSVELLEITPTPTIEDAMHKQLAAERVRRAAIVTAEGFRQKVKTQAEGEMQAAIALATGEKKVQVLRAKGKADGRVLIAKAEAQAVRMLAEQLRNYGVNATQYQIGLKYIAAFTALGCAAGSRTIFFPLQTSIVGSLADVAT